MNTFWIVIILLTLGSLVAMMPALWRQAKRVSDDTREENVIIARERLSEMDAELSAGTISQKIYDQSKEELERGLLDDVSAPRVEDIQESPLYGRVAMLVIVLFVPLLSIFMYNQYGAIEHLNVSGPGKPVAKGHSKQAPLSMLEMVAILEKKVEAAPEDPEAWYMLSRGYSGMQKFAKSASALEKAAELTNNHPTILVALADVLAMQQKGSLIGRPFELIVQVLDLDPENVSALWMAGNASYEQEDKQNALYFWRRAESELADQPKLLGELRLLIATVKAEAGIAGVTLDDPGTSIVEAIVTGGIPLHVTIAPELLDKTQKTDIVFIFAKAVSGPPMPLAAIKLTVADLPLKMKLTDANMLRPGTKVSDYTELKIAVRISKSGRPIASAGDMQSESVIVKTNTESTINLSINQIVE